MNLVFIILGPFLQILNIDRLILIIKVLKLLYCLPNPLSYGPIILSIKS